MLFRSDGADRENVMNAVEYLRGYKETGENVVIVGGGLTGCEIAYDAVLKGKKPVIVELMDDILNVPNLLSLIHISHGSFFRYGLFPVG